MKSNSNRKIVKAVRTGIVALLGYLVGRFQFEREAC